MSSFFTEIYLRHSIYIIRPQRFNSSIAKLIFVMGQLSRKEIDHNLVILDIINRLKTTCVLHHQKYCKALIDEAF